MSNISDDDEGHIERMKDIKKSEEMITRAREAGDNYLAARLERRKKGEELEEEIIRAREAGNDDLAAKLEKKLDDIDKYDEQLWFQDLRNRNDPILNPDVVYFIKIGNAIKIGHTRDMVGRLASLRAGTTEPISLIACFPGGQKLEKKIHDALDHARVSNEFFIENVACEFITKIFEFVEREAAALAAAS